MPLSHVCLRMSQRPFVGFKPVRSRASSQNLKRHYLKSLPWRWLSILGTNASHAVLQARVLPLSTPLDRRISSGLQIARYFLPREILKLIKRKRFFCGPVIDGWDWLARHVLPKEAKVAPTENIWDVLFSKNNKIFPNENPPFSVGVV